MPSQEQCCTMLLPPYIEVADGKSGSSASGKSSSDIKFGLEKGDTFQRIAILKRMIAKQINGESMKPYIMSVMKYCVPDQDHTLKRLIYYFWEVVDKTQENVVAAQKLTFSSGASSTPLAASASSLKGGGREDGGQGSRGAVTAQKTKTETLLPEMIMLCSYVRGDLQHPNEYVRGITLRFLCKIKEHDFLEPLVPAITANLNHRVSYVKRNAVLAIHNLYRSCPELAFNAPEMIEKFLINESDVCARRNAFNMLVDCAEDKANRYLFTHYFTVSEADGVTPEGILFAEDTEIFQLAVLAYIKKAIAKNPAAKGMYIPLIFAMLSNVDRRMARDGVSGADGFGGGGAVGATITATSIGDQSSAVQFECATTLLRLSTSPTALKQAIEIFIKLLSTHTDNNVGIICLQCLRDVQRRWPEVLVEHVAELSRSISLQGAYTYSLRLKILDLVVDLVGQTGGGRAAGCQHCERLIQFLRQELQRTQNEEADAASPGAFGTSSAAAVSNVRDKVDAASDPLLHYRQQLLRAMHLVATHSERGNTEIIDSVLSVMLNTLTEAPLAGEASTSSSAALACSAAEFIKEYLQHLDQLSVRTGRSHSTAKGRSNHNSAAALRDAQRSQIVAALIERLPSIGTAPVLRIVMWILGTYCRSAKEVSDVVTALRCAMEPFPIEALGDCANAGENLRGGEYSGQGDAGSGRVGGVISASTKTIVRDDGTYANVIVSAAPHSGQDSAGLGVHQSELRTLIVQHLDFFLASTLCGTLARLVVHISRLPGAGEIAASAQSAAVLVIKEILRFGTQLTQHTAVTSRVSAFDRDSHERIRLALAIATNPHDMGAFLTEAEALKQGEAVPGGHEKYAANGTSEYTHSGHAKSKHVISIGGRDVVAGRPRTEASGVISFSQLSKIAALDSQCRTAALSSPLLDGDDEILSVTQNNTLSAGGVGAEDDETAVTAPPSTALRVERLLAANMRALRTAKQLSGRNDPIYIEATVTVHHYDVMIEFFLNNQTSQTLSNLCIEVAAVCGNSAAGSGSNGDDGMRVVERPQYYTLFPNSTLRVVSNLKVSSTETGIVYGCCLFDVNVNQGNAEAVNSQLCGFGSPFNNALFTVASGSSTKDVAFTGGSPRYGAGGSCSNLSYSVDRAVAASSIRRCCVILDEIDVAITDYIKPSNDVSMQEFRQMWAAFEWENKIIVNTEIRHDIWAYVQRVMEITNMRALVEDGVRCGEDGRPDDVDRCPYLSVSLYARSIFGEHCLANVSLEMITDKEAAISASEGTASESRVGVIEGVIRIRSKTQAIALGLGERLSKMQRKNVSAGIIEA